MMSGDGFVHDTVTNPNPTSSNSAKRKRNLPGNPDPDAEIIALSPKSLMATNRFVCEICSKGFQRDQNLQLHRRGHNLPWKLKQRNKNEAVRKKVYICPVKSCVHHEPSRALGDLTGVKKHFSRKHGEKKWKCERCLKKYAVQSDWKAHSKICGTREYTCDCGTIFSRKDSFITHRAFCDPLTQENSRTASFATLQTATNINFHNDLMMMTGGNRIMNPGMKPKFPIWLHHNDNNNNINPLENPTIASSLLGSSSSNINNNIWLSRSQETVENNIMELPQGLCLKQEQVNNNNNNIGDIQLNNIPLYNDYAGCHNLPPHMSTTALLQKASEVGSTRSANPSGFGLFSSLNQSDNVIGGMMNGDGMMMRMMAGLTGENGGGVDSGEGGLTRDFLGVEGNERRVFSLQQELMKFTCPMNDDSNIGFSGN
ncbi:zinc finger protein JACKDAW-like [Bidens hawaiensis]|uniref:zinc finger protein JACKDAW-like n=1 Tax=Bidens hawaiensis TaxID=980011 RepID=UPI00404B005F